MTTRPRIPLKFKQKGRETVFARDAVRSVKLLRLRDQAAYRRPARVNVWELLVNDTTVFIGPEKSARRHQERALKYIS